MIYIAVTCISPQDLNLELLTPEATAMHRALRCLVAQLRDGAEANTTPLGLHVAQLQGCMAKVKEVDEARALQKHYEDKVVQLDEEVKRKTSPALQSKLERNQEKLQQASVASQSAQEVAQESLQQCAARRQNLQRIAGSFMTSLSKAFQAAVSNISDSSRSSGYTVPANVPAEDGLNPFTEDVLREATPVSPKDPQGPPPTASNPFPDSDSASGAESGPPDPGKWKPLESESENSTSPWAAQVDPKPQPEGEGLEGLEGDQKSERLSSWGWVV
eukprot:s413_g17.t1